MSVKTASRRRTDRFELPKDGGARVEFGFPWPGAFRCSMRLRDVSASGLSFVLGRELPGLEVGQAIESATLRWEAHAVAGDLVVMHLTPDNGAGSVCGALFLASGDENVVGLRALLQELALHAELNGLVLR